MLFSVIVPTHDRAAFLAEALESVRVQTVTDFECIVVDDASTDPVVLPFDDPRFRVIRRDVNGGPAAARNTGIVAAQGEYVAFLDDDDVYTPDRLDAAERGLRRAPVAFCGNGELGSTRATAPGYEGDVSGTILDRTTPHIGTIAVRRADCLLFDEQYGAVEDLDWLLRMTVAHRVTSESTTGWLWRKHSGDRGKAGTAARIAGSRLLLTQHAAYFKAHREAAAFRWLRIAMMSAQVNDRAGSRRAAVRAAVVGRRLPTFARAARLIAGI